MEDYAGWIKVGTKVDEKGLDKGITNIRQKMAKLEEKAKMEFTTKEGVKVTSGWNLDEREQKYYDRLTTTLEQLEQKKMELLAPEREINNELNNQIEKTAQIEEKYNTWENGILKTSSGLTLVKKNTSDVKEEIEEVNEELKESNKNILNFSGGMSNILKKVAKWGLAVFGVRSAYTAVRKAINILSQSNQQLATDINYIQYASAKVLEPLITRLIQLVYKFLSYVNYIYNAWFDKSLFGEATAENFEKANASANKLKKTISSFDEVNTVSSGSASGGITAPSFDLSKLQDIKIPDWIKWIADNKELFVMLGEVLLIAFGWNSISRVLSNIAMLFGVSGGMGLIGLSEILLVIASPVLIYFAVKGLREAIDEIKEFNQKVKENTSISNENKNANEQLTKQIIEKTKAEQMNDKETRTAIDYLKKHTSEVSTLNDNLEKQKNWLGVLTGSNKELKEQQENLRDETIQDIDAWNELTSAGKTTKEEQDKFNETIWNTILSLEKSGINTDELRKKYETLSGKKYVATVNGDISNAETGLNKILQLLAKIAGFNLNMNFSSNAGYGGGGGGGRGFATGAIINYPGKGVPIGQKSYGGEAGMEGLIPLTDIQAMETLGSIIGKNVVLTLTNNVLLDGRVVSRNQNIVKSDQDFILNR